MNELALNEEIEKKQRDIKRLMAEIEEQEKTKKKMEETYERLINEKTKEAVKDGKKVCVICTDETEDAFAAKIKKSVGSRADEASVGKELYRVLRECDDEDIEVIFSESFDATGFGQAIMNRLLKAAGHHVINVD